MPIRRPGCERVDWKMRFFGLDPVQHLRVLVGSIVVEHDVDLLVRGAPEG